MTVFKSIIKYCLSTFCILSFFTCERPLPFSNLPQKPLLVANAFFTPDSIWQVQLGWTEALDNSISFSEITDGTVKIKNLASGQTVNLRHQRNGIYTATTALPAVGKKYELMASASNFSTLRATDEIPNTFAISVQSFQPSRYQNQPNYLFDIVIEDDATTPNFYLATITYVLEKNGQKTVEKAGHFSLDINSENETIFIDHFALKQSYLTDEDFNGTSYITRIGATSSLLNEVDVNDQLSAIISVKSISEVGYLYEKSVERFENLEELLYTEPVPIYSNMEGGLGIFAGYLEVVTKVELR
ncbi:MAG: DUF4249 domain-containing protein [Bacteroidota bacterium]